MGRHRPRGLEGARTVDADEVQVLADVTVPPEAGGALATGLQRPSDDAISHRPVLYFGPDLLDRPGHLVPDHLGHLDPWVHVAGEDVQIRAADPGRTDGDLNLALTRLRRGNIQQRQVPGPLLLLSDFTICLLGKLRYVSDTTWLSQGIDDQVYSELQPSLTRVC